MPDERDLIPESTYVQERSIGGSDAGAILGVNRYKTAVEVWDRINGIGRQQGDNAAMERGRAMEPIIAEKYYRETGRQLIVQPRQYHTEHPFLHASPDRVIVSGARVEASGPGVLEIKSMGSFPFKRTKELGIDPSYYAQLQHYMFVLDLKWGSFACFNADAWELHWFDVNRDEVFIAEMVDKVVDFWTNHIETNIRPSAPRPEVPIMVVPAVGGDAEVRDEVEWKDAMAALREARETLGIAKHRAELAEQQIKDMMGDTEKVIVPGHGKVTWTTSVRRTFQKDEFLAAHPELCDVIEDYYSATESRTFRPTFEG